jgi:hypothetical protein
MGKLLNHQGWVELEQSADLILDLTTPNRKIPPPLEKLSQPVAETHPIAKDDVQPVALANKLQEAFQQPVVNPTIPDAPPRESEYENPDEEPTLRPKRKTSQIKRYIDEVVDPENISPSQENKKRVADEVEMIQAKAKRFRLTFESLERKAEELLTQLHETVIE